jgi:hypothetical protein
LRRKKKEKIIMKKKILMILVMASVMFALIAMDYGSALAGANANAKKTSTYTKAKAQVKDGPKDEETTQGGENTTSQANAYSSNSNGSWASASAYASNMYGRLYEWEHEKEHIMPLDWGNAKFDSVVAETDFACSLYAVSGQRQQAALWTGGNAKLFPLEAGGNNISLFTLRVTDETEATCFFGEILVNSYGVSTKGVYEDNIGIASSILGDTMFLMVDRVDPVTYSGSYDSLLLDSKIGGHAENVPTTTEWGLAVLVALVIGSAVFVMTKRRRVRIPA